MVQMYTSTVHYECCVRTVDVVRQDSPYYMDIMSDQKDSGISNMSVDEFYEELKQHPAFMTDYDLTKPLPEALEGLQAMKYQSDSCDDNALSYKQDGNKNFELGKYRWAIDSYTEGIKCRPTDQLLNAILYTNRAAANYRIGNFRSALNDCIEARKFKSNHLKAIARGAMCYVELKLFPEAIAWCDEALEISPTDEKMKNLRAEADKLLREQERSKRRELAAGRKKAHDQQQILSAVQERGIIFFGSEGSSTGASSCLFSLKSHHPSGAQVSLNSDGVLVWPVMLLYPEYSETDFIEAFSELSLFSEHLEAMFAAERPCWDVDGKYQPDHLQVFFESKDMHKLYEVDVNSTLLSALLHKRYVVHDGMPCFLVVVRDSPFARHFIALYDK